MLIKNGEIMNHKLNFKSNKIGILFLSLFLAITLDSCFMLPSSFSETVYTPNKEKLITIVGHVFSKENAVPIKNIKITGDYGYTRTDANGYYELLVYLDKTNQQATLVFEDDDGNKNEGKFKKTELSVTDKKNNKSVMHVFELNIQLEKEGAE